MAPTLRPGDALLVREGGRTRVGSVVVACFPSRPDLLVVKRVLRAHGELWWVEGDNPEASDDSRTYGPAQVVARARWRYWPLPPLRIRG